MKKLLMNAPGRITRSFGYSWNGCKATFRKEESFRLETIAFVVLLACLASSPWPLWKCLAMVGSFLLIPLAEIVNSAIEDICDFLIFVIVLHMMGSHGPSYYRRYPDAFRVFTPTCDTAELTAFFSCHGQKGFVGGDEDVLYLPTTWL